MTDQVPRSTVERATSVVRLEAGAIEYRLESRGTGTVVIFHGGHQRAGLSLGEEVFADAGYSVLVPSRPGYGRTPLTTGRSAPGFSDVTRSLCEHLGISTLAAVVGVSGGGPSAVTMASLFPDLVERLILESAVGPLPWPDSRTRLAAHVAPATERGVWSALRTVLRISPEAGLLLLLGGLTTLPARDVLAAMRIQDRGTLVAQLSRMRSGSGFLNDLRTDPAILRGAAARVDQPTLVIATRNDGGVPFAHAQALVTTIRAAELVESRADSHFLWFGPDWPAISTRITDFLAAPVDPPSERA